MGADKSGWVVHRVLAGQAAARGDRPFLQLLDRPPLTFAETDALALRLANGLLAHAVAQGQRVAVMPAGGTRTAPAPSCTAARAASGCGGRTSPPTRSRTSSTSTP